jgi:CRISPR-associated endonuclease/helicase Cas3
MCAAHRAKVLAEIRDDLAAGRPCRVVSTSLVEAGVDVGR